MLYPYAQKMFDILREVCPKTKFHPGIGGMGSNEGQNIHPAAGLNILENFKDHGNHIHENYPGNWFIEDIEQSGFGIWINFNDWYTDEIADINDSYCSIGWFDAEY